jgi:6-pyruvoyltetrahydropterin/6-carboxytetrahydropterin synthase
MFTLTKEFRFEASHQLPHHAGKCRRLHGHSWKFAVIMEGAKLRGLGSDAGMLMDYGRITDVVKPIVEEKLDHYHLNDSLGMENPTSEAIAAWLFREIRARLAPDERMLLFGVRVEETCTASASFCARAE